MSLLKDLIQTVGLDATFFYQLALACGLYFISKKILFQPFIAKHEERQRLTKGRMEGGRGLEKKIEEQKILYEQKAKELNSKFQEVFGKIKAKAQEDYLKDKARLEEQNNEQAAEKRARLSSELKAQEAALEKDLPDLTKLLVEKISG